MDTQDTRATRREKTPYLSIRVKSNVEFINQDKVVIEKIDLPVTVATVFLKDIIQAPAPVACEWIDQGAPDQR